MFKHQITIDTTPENAQKFASLSKEKQEELKILLNLKLQELINQKTENTGLTEESVIAKWHYLQENNQELDSNNPLSDDEIKIIRQNLIRNHQTRPVGVAKGQFIVPDSFDSPLPDEILDLFYSL